LNTQFLTNNEFVTGLNTKLEEWKEMEFANATIKWDFLKYKIREFAMRFSKKYWKKQREIETTLQKELEELNSRFADTPNEELSNACDAKRLELENLYERKTEGAIVRARANWHEHGEKSNKYFLNLEKRNQSKKNIKQLNVDGKMINNPDSIISEQAKFYKALYSSRNGYSDQGFDEFTEGLNVPHLADELKQSCEGILTNMECQKVIKEMKNNKSPGNDGLPIELYKIFWPSIGHEVVNCFNHAHANGNMSNSQKQAVITLIDKPGKDRLFLKNWRPISLLNVDYKIVTKAIGKRLQRVLPTLIHSNQTGFVEKRYIGDSIRTIIDAMEITRRQNIPGLLMALDFEKAFDSIEWPYLIRVLESFNFGVDFIQWIKTFYNGASSCTINNGVTSQYFELERGVGQGDPISPYLFLLAVEILTIRIRHEKNIKGLVVGGEESKLVAHADDITTLLREVTSARLLLRIVSDFGKVSGLVLNKNKCEGRWLGSLRKNNEEPLGIKWSPSPLRILGIYMTYDNEDLIEYNFRQRIPALQKLLRIWSTRGLSIMGKVTIVKTFAISQFIFAASMLPVPPDTIKLVNAVIYNFIWNYGSEKIKRSVLSGDLEQGGLKMLDLGKMIEANKIMWVKRLFDVEISAFWKRCVDIYLKPFGGKDVLFHSDYERVLLLGIKSIPKFYEDMLISWKKVQVPCKSLIWNNRAVLTNGKTLFWRSFYKEGIIHYLDLVDENKQPRDYKEGLSWIKWAGLIKLIPKENQTLQCNGNCGKALDNIIIRLDKQLNLKQVTSRQVYHFLIGQVKVLPTSINRFSQKLGLNVNEVDWRAVLVRPHLSAIETYMKCFQFKILHNILPVNEKLFIWKIKNSPQCSLCGVEIETAIHLFTECSVCVPFWDDFNSWAEKYCQLTQRLTAVDKLFGVDNNKLLDYCLILAKYTIFKQKEDKKIVFKYFTNLVEKKMSTERHIGINGANI
jgi:hypothetical protein